MLRLLSFVRKKKLKNMGHFDLFFDIISFQHVLQFDVGRSDIEWNMKLKMEILIFTYI